MPPGRKWLPAALAAAFALLAIGVPALHAQEPEEPAAAAEAAPPAAGAGSSPSLDDPALLERARSYTRGSWILYLVDVSISLALLAALSFSGLSARLWRWVRDHFGEGARGTIVYLAAFITVVTLASLPLDYYDGYVREHAYGFSTQSFADWAADLFKGLMVVTVASTIFVVPLFAVIRRFPRSWWALGAGLGCVFAVFMVAVEPVFVAPIFNNFTRLKEGELRTTILDLAHRNGIHADDVFEMDASARSSHDNAYVSGLLGTERIVLYDTLVNSYDRDEVAFVMGHEMGHYVLRHLWKGLGLVFVLIVAGFWIVDRVTRWVVRRWPRRTGFEGVGDLATLPAMLFVLLSFLFVTLPIQSAFSRKLEAEADRFGLASVQVPEAAPGAFRKMAERNLADPDPPAAVEWFLYSHPAIGKRIRAAEEYLASKG